MADDHDLEKGEVPTVGHLEELVKKGETKALDMDNQDSNHSRRRSSEDTIEPTPVDDVQHTSRTKSHTSSTRSRPLSIIPRSKRRGLLGRFTVIPEIERPYDYRNSIKWAITAFVALAAAAAPVGSAIFYRRSSHYILYHDGHSCQIAFKT